MRNRDNKKRSLFSSIPRDGDKYNVISNWKKGECYTWPTFRYHLAANAGIKDLYLLAITGLRNDT